MGGTFDPVHYGHLVIAEVARDELGLERVIWIPAGDPPHKRGENVTAAVHRHAMLLAATGGNPHFEVSTLEIERRGPSYSLLTLREMQERLPDAELYFITGADAILELLTWHRHEEVIQACRFAVVTRPGYDLARLPEVLPAAYLERITTIVAPGVAISGTDIRARVAAGKTVRYLVPEAVERYVRENSLWR